MPITRVQANKAVATSANSPMPAWGSTTVAGNLLLITANKGGSGAWTDPAGYTPFTGYSGGFAYHSVQGNSVGVYWKIAAGGDATPPVIASTGSSPWEVYTYEFSSPTGWLATPEDKTVHSGATNVGTSSVASGSTATLSQASELAVAVCALSAAGTTGFAFTNSFTIDNPATPDDRLQFGWKEVSATTALSTTASWTGSTVACCLVATFMVAPSPVRRIRVVRHVWAGK